MAPLSISIKNSTIIYFCWKNWWPSWTMFFCLPKEWYSDVPYNIRYIIYHGASPLGGFWCIYIYIYTDLNAPTWNPNQQLHEKRQQFPTCLHPNARLGHLFTLTKGPTKTSPRNSTLATVRWRPFERYPSLRIQSPSQMMIGVYNHLLRKVFRFHYHSQKVIGSLGLI